MQEAGLQEVGVFSHVFQDPHPPGIAVVVILDSSHFAVHTYASSGAAALDLFACGSQDLEPVAVGICEEMGLNLAQATRIHRLTRQMSP